MPNIPLPIVKRVFRPGDFVEFPIVGDNPENFVTAEILRLSSFSGVEHYAIGLCYHGTNHPEGRIYEYAWYPAALLEIQVKQCKTPNRHYSII